MQVTRRLVSWHFRPSNGRHRSWHSTNRVNPRTSCSSTRRKGPAAWERAGPRAGHPCSGRRRGGAECSMVPPALATPDCLGRCVAHGGLLSRDGRLMWLGTGGQVDRRIWSEQRGRIRVRPMQLRATAGDNSGKGKGPRAAACHRSDCDTSLPGPETGSDRHWWRPRRTDCARRPAGSVGKGWLGGRRLSTWRERLFFFFLFSFPPN